MNGSRIPREGPKYPELTRKLRHVQIFMIAISATIGVGIFVRSGETLAIAGPAGTIVAFGLVAIVAMSVMDGIAEMIEIWPIPNPFVEFVAIFVEEDLGIVMGIAYWYAYAMSFEALLVTAAQLITLWHSGEEKVIQGVVIYVVCPLIMFGLNCLGVFWVGTVEAIFGTAKILFVLVSFLLMLSISGGDIGEAGANNSTLNVGFEANPNVVVHKSHVAAICVAIPVAAFAYVGVETVATTAFEAKSRKDMQPPARGIARWVAVLYLLSVFGSVINVSWKDPYLPPLYTGEPGNSMSASQNSCTTFSAAKRASSSEVSPLSPLTLAFQNVGSPVGESAITVCLVLVVLSTANADLYIASRTMFSLIRKFHPDAKYRGSETAHQVERRSSRQERCWRQFLRFICGSTRGTDTWFFGKVFEGVPLGSLLISVLCFCWIPYIHFGAVDSTGNAQDVLSSIGTVGCLLVWASQALAYIRFDNLRRKYPSQMKEAGYHREPSLGQPYIAWFALFSCLAIVFLFNTASWWSGTLNASNGPARVLEVIIGPIVLLLIWLCVKLIRKRTYSGRRASKDDPQQFLKIILKLRKDAEDNMQGNSVENDPEDGYEGMEMTKLPTATGGRPRDGSPLRSG